MAQALLKSTRTTEGQGNNKLFGKIIVLNEAKEFLANYKTQRLKNAKSRSESTYSKKFDAVCLIDFINGLQEEMENEMKNPNVAEDLQNDETNVLGHEIVLLDMIKNFIESQ